MASSVLMNTVQGLAMPRIGNFATGELMVKKAEPMDDPILRAAEGYLELGMLDEAALEIEKLPFELQDTRDVWALRCRIYEKAEQWDALGAWIDGGRIVGTDQGTEARMFLRPMRQDCILIWS